MKRSNTFRAGIGAAAAAVLLCAPAYADPDKNEIGPGRGKEHSREYKEERKCDGYDKRRHGKERPHHDEYRSAPSEHRHHREDDRPPPEAIYRARPTVIHPNGDYVYRP